MCIISKYNYLVPSSLQYGSSLTSLTLPLQNTITRWGHIYWQQCQDIRYLEKNYVTTLSSHSI